MNRFVSLLPIFIFFSFIPVAHGLSIQSNNGHYTISTNVLYDVSLEPVTGASVYYAFVSGEAEDCRTQTYPSEQTLDEVDGENNPGVYENVVDALPEGPNAICVKAVKPGFGDSYKFMSIRESALEAFLRWVLNSLVWVFFV